MNNSIKRFKVQNIIMNTVKKNTQKSNFKVDKIHKKGEDFFPINTDQLNEQQKKYDKETEIHHRYFNAY